MKEAREMGEGVRKRFLSVEQTNFLGQCFLVWSSVTHRVSTFLLHPSKGSKNVDCLAGSSEEPKT